MRAQVAFNVVVEFTVQAFTPRGAVHVRLIPANQRSNVQVLLWAIAVCRL